MRSRYTAFTLGAVDYLLETHHPRTRAGVSFESVAEWAASEWLGLKVVQAKGDTVSFEARDQYVSRHQAELQVIRGRRWLRGGDWDTGRPTTNGTLVNGQNLDGAGLALLRNGDRLRVGDSFFRYEEAAL